MHRVEAKTKILQPWVALEDWLVNLSFHHLGRYFTHS
jgi:hypothetical protein